MRQYVNESLSLLIEKNVAFSAACNFARPKTLTANSHKPRYKREAMLTASSAYSPRLFIKKATNVFDASNTSSHVHVRGPRQRRTTADRLV
jgi:hypothetical protein